MHSAGTDLSRTSGPRLDHGAFFPSLFLLVATILAWRFAFNLLIHSPQLVENILIVGTGPVAVALARQIASSRILRIGSSVLPGMTRRPRCRKDIRG